MLKKLRLERFKSFEDAEIELGPFTVVVGTNASGKSNLRDALRFLHGVARGYTLAEIIGEKWGEEGVLQWRGIRGGIREIAFGGTSSFALELTIGVVQDRPREISYRIEVDLGDPDAGPRVRYEWMRVDRQHPPVFEAYPDPNADQGPATTLLSQIAGVLWKTSTDAGSQPMLPRLGGDSTELPHPYAGFAKALVQALKAMRFFDLNPESMRTPSVPGQTILTDRGENLSSVLQSIHRANQATTLVHWLQELTPMDVVSLDFERDAAGRVLATLVEEGGRRTTAYSASDGTLRFLAMLAALLGPEPAQFYFLEELENGLHPTRLSLLLDLIERQTAKGSTQVVATTHSPQLLGLLRNGALEHAAETYRLEDSRSCGIRRILDIPHAREVIEAQGLTRLHASGWLEDAISFTEERSAP